MQFGAGTHAMETQIVTRLRLTGLVDWYVEKAFYAF